MAGLQLLKRRQIQAVTWLQAGASPEVHSLKASASLRGPRAPRDGRNVLAAHCTGTRQT